MVRSSTRSPLTTSIWRATVSYTHLDVYKRQAEECASEYRDRILEIERQGEVFSLSLIHIWICEVTATPDHGAKRQEDGRCQPEREIEQ